MWRSKPLRHATSVECPSGVDSGAMVNRFNAMAGFVEWIRCSLSQVALHDERAGTLMVVRSLCIAGGVGTIHDSRFTVLGGE